MVNFCGLLRKHKLASRTSKDLNSCPSFFLALPQNLDTYINSFQLQIPEDSQRIPQEFLKNCQRIPIEFQKKNPMNSNRIAKELPKKCQRIPIEFQKNQREISKKSPKSPRRISQNFKKSPKDPKKIPKEIHKDFENIQFPTSPLEAKNPFELFFSLF